MVDLTNRTIKKIFEQQVKDLTLRTVATREDSFDCLWRHCINIAGV